MLTVLLFAGILLSWPSPERYVMSLLKSANHAQAVYKGFGGVVFSEEEGRKLAAALGPKGKGMVLRNHGLLVCTAAAPFDIQLKLTRRRL